MAGKQFVDALLSPLITKKRRQKQRKTVRLPNYTKLLPKEKEEKEGGGRENGVGISYGSGFARQGGEKKEVPPRRVYPIHPLAL